MTTCVELLIVWLAMVVVMALGWQWQRQRSNAGIVDALWAAGLAGSAAWFASMGEGAPAPRIAVGVLGGLWGLRLALHLWQRVRHESEDGRYRALRERWQGSQVKFFAFFQFQAALVPLFALPFLAVATAPAWTVWSWLGVGIWIAAVAGESIADAQLARFRADPANRGRTCRVGLWNFSRHPNYFFEWLHWFAYVALAVGSPLAWLAWGAPVVMFVFLRWLSGIPFTEQQTLRSRGDDYRAYQRTTSVFFPWFPKRPAP